MPAESKPALLRVVTPYEALTATQAGQIRVPVSYYMVALLGKSVTEADINADPVFIHTLDYDFHSFIFLLYLHLS